MAARGEPDLRSRGWILDSGSATGRNDILRTSRVARNMDVFRRGRCRCHEEANKTLTTKQTSRRLAITTIDALIEVGLVVLPCAMFGRVQMPWSKKAKVMLAFACRLM
jgi:hypothetical protein